MDGPDDVHGRTRGSQIASVGHYLPAKVLANDALASQFGVDESWIERRTGIAKRHIASQEETVVDLAEASAKNAIKLMGASAYDIDAVIVATSTADISIPSCAAQLAGRLKLRSPATFDVTTACAGFCTAIAIADSLIRTHSAHAALVVGADRSSSWVDPLDRNTSILFGDGAGAAILIPSARRSVGPVIWGSAGDRSSVIGIDPRTRRLRQDGTAVFRWATGLGYVLERICKQSNRDISEIDAFIPHQANLRITSALGHSIGLNETKLRKDVTVCGNTIAASIPIALSRFVAEASPDASGRNVLMFGFGAGLAYAGQIVTL